MDEIKKLRACINEGLELLPHGKQARSLLQGNKKMQAYIRRVCEQEGTVSSQIVIGAARGIVATLISKHANENCKLIFLTNYH